MATDVLDLKAVLGLDSSAFDNGLNKIKSGFGSVAKVGAAAIGAATTATVAFAGKAVKAGESFDKSMSQVAATMGKSMDEMQNEVGSTTVTLNGQIQEFSGNLRDFAQFMGQNTAFSASQAADALNYMALAGYDAQQSMEMLPNVLNLAAAGDMELARASDMVTDASTAFGLSVEEDGARITQMVDEMAKAASTGNTSVEQLGDAFLTVGGLTQELNGGFVTLSDGTQASVDGIQELEIALTAMANAGVKGSEAGTHMRNMLLKLASPTSDGTKQLEALGVSVFDAEGNMRSLQDVFGDLNGALSNLTQEEKIQAIGDLFNTRDLASAEALLGAVNQDWNKIGESILNADGAASKMADTQLDNLAGDITLFKSALEGAQITLSDQLTPALREFVQFGTKGLTEITDGFKEGGLEGAMSAFGDILSEGISMIVGKAPEFVKAGMELLAALGKGLMDNINVILFAIGDIAEIILNGLLEATSGQDSALLQILDHIIGVFQENYEQLIQVGMQIISNILTGLGKALPELIPRLVDVLLDIVQILIDNIDILVDGAIALVTGLAQGIIDALPILVERIPEIIVAISNALVENIPKLLVAAAEIITGLTNALIEGIPQMLESIPQIVESMVNGFTEAIENLSPEQIENGVKTILDMIKGIIKALPQLIALGPKIIKALLEAIVKAVPALMKAGKAIESKITESFKGTIEKAKQWGKDLIKNFVGGMKGGDGLLKTGLSWAGNTVKKYLHFSEPDEGPLSDFHTYAPDMMKLFAEGVKDNTNLVTDQIEKSFDFSDVMSAQNYSTDDMFGFADKLNAIPLVSQKGGNESQMLNISLELNDVQLAKAIYRLYNDETQRVGVNLVKGGV